LKAAEGFEEERSEAVNLAAEFNDITTKLGVLFVAAAGNQSRIRNHNATMQGKPQLGDWKKASYPASAPFVYTIGAVCRPRSVSAMPQRTVYSNMPDPRTVTDAEQLWVFGGEYKNDCDTLIDPARQIASPITRNYREGMLGMCTRAAHGYAYWAGTSFATGVASGALAYVLRYYNLTVPGEVHMAMKHLQQYCAYSTPLSQGSDYGPVLRLFQTSCNPSTEDNQTKV
jgi:hypothetical protein